MSSQILMILLVLFTLFQTSTSFDYYALVLQWPPGFCHKDHPDVNICKRSVRSILTIHGLWPSNVRGGNPSPVHRSWLSDRGLQRIILQNRWPSITKLQKSWPQVLYGRTDWEFWAQEWNRHGRADTGTESEYFARALDAYDDHDPMIDLQRAGIVPDEVKTYSTPSFQAAIDGNPQLRCFKNPEADNYILYEIKSCYEAVSGTRRTECPRFSLFSCGGATGQILFLPRVVSNSKF
ncbi:Intracellular ribonuclease LX [Linum grandiflorum]